MVTAQITLTDREIQNLESIGQRTGKSRDELLREAVDQLITRFQPDDWREKLRQAQGIWKDRDDLPDFEELRREWDRH